MLLMSSPQTTRTAEGHNTLRKIIKSQVRYFKCNSDVQRYEELKNLKKYLHYRIVYTTYNSRLASAVLTVDDLGKKHVDAEFLKFDMAERQRRKTTIRGREVALVPSFSIF